MNNRLYLWAACFIFLFSACKKESVPASSAALPENIHNITVRNLDFQSFSARGRMQLEEEDGSKVASNLSLRILKDSIIWASVVPALGIEVARLRITPDSVMLVNRLNKTYFAGDYSLIREKFKVDVTFDMVQAILLGNYLPGNPGEEKVMTEPPLQRVRREQASLLIDQFLDLTDFKLKKLSIKDQQTNNALDVQYSGFENVEGHSFARNARIVVQQPNGSTSKGAIADLEYSRITLNEAGLTFPFSIPEAYTRK
ncbi:MAG: DUF4292 domain-containing protein [Adhaeribacter sp.]